ncbi:MAG: FAD-dependent oxidoreductase [Shimia sp.]
MSSPDDAKTDAFDYDLFVIGGGSGGVRAARTAAAEGARVAIAEESRMGGTCVIRGCVPKKLMVFASSYRDTLAEAELYGWDVVPGGATGGPDADGYAFDWPAFQAKLTRELERLEEVYRKLLRTSDVDIHDQRATLADAHTVRLADGTEKTAKHVLVATGGHPTRPDTPNAHLGLVSDDLFHLEALPRSILIVGGGYIACEFACILHNLGVKVTIMNRRVGILRGFDEEARGLIQEAMTAKGIEIRGGSQIIDMQPAGSGGDGAQPTASDAAMGADAGSSRDLRPDAAPEIGPGDGPLWVKSSTGHEAVYDAVLFATGRAPSTADMGLEEAGVRLGRGGEVEVDEYSQSSVPSIYAIGDVTKRVELTPVAIREGMAFVETVFKGNPTPVDHALIPTAIFTQPEMGTIGLSEEEAQAQEACDVYCTSFRAMRGAFVDKPDRVLMKLIVSQETDRVLGCHIVADGAGEMIQLAGIAIKMGATKAQFDAVCAVHPTMAEELVTMRSPMRSGGD